MASKVEANIIGLFLLPDVYSNSGTLPTSQIKNVRANAYASIKELNAINVLATMPERGAEFKYSYRPGRILRDGETPFASLTFIDFESSKGGNLGRSLNNYLQMAIRAGHLLIFTPLGQKYGSMTVNDVRSRIAASQDGNSNIYSGIGISALIYPYDSMRNYLADRLVVSNIGDDWIRLDNLFQRRLDRYTELEREGKAPGEKPKIEESYLRNFELLAVEEELHFFQNLWRELHPEVTDEDTKRSEIHPLVDKFLDSLCSNARNSFWRTASLESVERRQNIDSTVLGSDHNFSDQVRMLESILDQDLAKIDSALRTEPESIFNAAWTSADDSNEEDWKPHYIQSYIVKGGPHPVRSRAFLYQLRQRMLDLRRKLDPTGNRTYLFRIANVFNHDRDPDSPARGDPLIYELADEADGTGPIMEFFTGRKRKFSGKYVNYFNGSVRGMKKFADDALISAILDELDKELEVLLRAYSGLFSEIFINIKGIDEAN